MDWNEMQDGFVNPVFISNETKKLAKSFIPDQLEFIKNWKNLMEEKEFKEIFDKFKALGK